MDLQDWEMPAQTNSLCYKLSIVTIVCQKLYTHYHVWQEKDNVISFEGQT